MTSRVERILEDDWTTLRELRIRALTDAPTAFLGNLAGETGRDDAYWRSKCRDEVWLAAYDGSQSVGIAHLHCGDDPSEPMHIESMWVDNNFRRAGIAKSLVYTLEDWALSNGRDELRLWVFADNEQARRLFQSLDYSGPVNQQHIETTRGVLLEEEFRKSLSCSE